MKREAMTLAASLLLSATTANAGPMGWKCGQTEVWLWVDKDITPHGYRPYLQTLDSDLFDKQGLHFRPHWRKNVEYLLNGKPCRYWDPMGVGEEEARAARYQEQAKTILKGLKSYHGEPTAHDVEQIVNSIMLFQ